MQRSLALLDELVADVPAVGPEGAALRRAIIRRERQRMAEHVTLEDIDAMLAGISPVSSAPRSVGASVGLPTRNAR